VNTAPVQLRWDHASQHRAFLAGLGLLDNEPVLTLDVLLALHTILLPPSNPARGRFRDAPIQVRFNGVTHWVPPDATEAAARTTVTLERINGVVAAGERGDSMKAAAAVALWEITDLHPFADGNGRVARSVAAWMLTRGGYALLMDPGRYCHERRAEYFRALDSKVLDPAPWRAFFDGLVAWCFRRVPA
jgi:Fic family protein